MINGQSTGLAVLEQAVLRGIANVGAGLTEMVGVPFRAEATGVHTVSLGDALVLVGDPARPVIGIYLGVTADAHGHILLLFEERAALRLADLLLGRPPGSTVELGEMEQSALAELGNIAGSFFVNVLADECGLEIHPTPPIVLRDMCGAILDAPVADVGLERDEVLVIGTRLSQDGEAVEGRFLVLPSYALLETLLRHLAKEHSSRAGV
jgi:chemotaxis protein CheC